VCVGREGVVDAWRAELGSTVPVKVI